ncbi:hypothetical protein PIB30_095672, partial [Stylosanthes scabra]|nr:hypothetical protein [Stylosanthes scabra]
MKPEHEYDIDLAKHLYSNFLADHMQWENQVESLMIVQRTSNGGRDARFGTKRCAFDDESYGVAESYNREGVNVE